MSYLSIYLFDAVSKISVGSDFSRFSYFCVAYFFEINVRIN